MVNRPFSYFYNIFFRGVKRFCVNGQQLSTQLPEIRAAAPNFRRSNRADSPELRFPPGRSRAARRMPAHPPKYFLFMTFLQQHRPAHLEILPVSRHVRAGITERTPPAWGSCNNGNSSFFINRLRRATK
jgi:hypothetical protein